MPYIVLIISSILSAAVSAAVTVYLLKYFILKHKHEFFEASGGRQISGNSTVKTAQDVVDTDSPSTYRPDLKTLDDTILISISSPKIKPRLPTAKKVLALVQRLLNFSVGFFKVISKKIMYYLHVTVHFASLSLDRLLGSIFNTFGMIFGIILVPVSNVWSTIKDITFENPLRSVGQILKDFFVGIRDTLTKIYIFVLQRVSSHASVEKDIQSVTEVVVALKTNEDKKLQQKDIKDSEIILPSSGSPETVEGLTFSKEIYLIALSLFLIVIPFAFNLRALHSSTFLLYFTIFLFIGSYLLLKKRSPRVFWTIGVGLWTALSVWYFDGVNSVEVGGAVIFLCTFLLVYAISSYLWYGISKEQQSMVESGFFVLHPFLYLAAVYLLLISGSRVFVLLLCSSVAALYIYFGQELQKRKTNDKAQNNFIVICYFVALVATLMLVCVATNGFWTVAAISGLILLYTYFTQIPRLTFLLTLLVTLVGQTLGTTNSASSYSFIANERSITYITAASICIYIIDISKKRNKVLSRIIQTSAVLALATVAFFGITVELLDAKQNSQIFEKNIPELLLSATYLVTSIWLFYRAKKDNDIFIKVAAALFSFYTLYFIFNNLLS